MKKKSIVGQSVVVSVLLMAALFLLPLAVVAPFQETELPPEELAEEVPKMEKPAVPIREDSAQLLRVLQGDTVVEMDLCSYLLGVVRAEMPASFPQEALKAQAVAARTYTLYKLRGGGNHDGLADLCTDYACCHAWLDEEQARMNWGEDAAVYERKVEEAVRATDGQAILYEGEPILAVFHSSSAGRTRAAGDVWQSDLPYLRGVDSPEGGEDVPNYYSRVEFTAEAFRKAVLAAIPEAKLSGDTAGWLKSAVIDQAGSVETVEVGGVAVRGTQLRTILGLRSACFTWEAEGEKLVFYVTGYGHGVGLSQYGAGKMAEEGADYREILTHYYTGATVGPWRA